MSNNIQFTGIYIYRKDERRFCLWKKNIIPSLLCDKYLNYTDLRVIKLDHEHGTPTLGK